MLTIEETAVVLGMFSRQLRRRLEVAAPLLNPYIKRGPKNRVLLDGSAIEVLRAVEDYRLARYGREYPPRNPTRWNPTSAVTNSKR